jgi:tetrathionate reductase subunit B
MAKQYGMVIDIASCIGCDVCSIACKQENQLSPSENDIPGSREWPVWIKVHRLLQGTYPDLEMNYLPMMCMSCKEPPCVEACTYQAIHRRKDGIIQINAQLCDGCKDSGGGPRCVPACPYEAIYLDDKKNVAMTCTFCAPRIDAGLEPACVKACEGRCLIWGDLGDPNSEVSRVLRAAGDKAFVLKPEEGTGPNIWYIRPPKLSPAQVNGLMRKIGKPRAKAARAASGK